MSDIQSKLVNVIESRSGSDVVYHTLEGLLIGGFKGGERISKVEPDNKKTLGKDPKGGVVNPKTPLEVKREKEKEVQAMQTPEGRLKNLKENVV